MIMIIIMTMTTMMLMEIETTWMSLHMSNWRFKIHNKKKKSGTSFNKIFKESRITIQSNDAKIKQSRQIQKNHAPIQSMFH